MQSWLTPKRPIIQPEIAAFQDIKKACPKKIVKVGTFPSFYQYLMLTLIEQTGSLLRSFDDDDDDWGPIILQWYMFLVRVGLNHLKWLA